MYEQQENKTVLKRCINDIMTYDGEFDFAAQSKLTKNNLFAGKLRVEWG